MVNLAPISAILRAYQNLRASLVSQLVAKDEIILANNGTIAEQAALIESLSRSLIGEAQAKASLANILDIRNAELVAANAATAAAMAENIADDITIAAANEAFAAQQQINAQQAADAATAALEATATLAAAQAAAAAAIENANAATATAIAIADGRQAELDAIAAQLLVLEQENPGLVPTPEATPSPEPAVAESGTP
jgi:trimeric autotransporter adhesin